MTQYKLRPVVVKAIAVGDIGGAIADPAWVVAAIANGQIVAQPGSSYAVKTTSGKVVAVNGQTIIRDMLGDLSVMDSGDFNALYQPTQD